MTRIKICGITNLDDALAAVEAGVHALGFNFSTTSPRAVAIQQAREIIAELPPFVSPVGIFVEHSPEEISRICRECGLHYAQLHSEQYTAERSLDVSAPGIIRVFRTAPGFDMAVVDAYCRASGITNVLFDAYRRGQPGGTGETIDREMLLSIFSDRKRASRSILAGGLKPDNVRDAVLSAQPYGVDTASGVESAPGKKDHGKIRSFVLAVQDADTILRSKAEK
ncbi:MAG: phosphoribosylanthranilate isomerase [Prosthecochloris sp.]|nr:phosphoribosylanthranilate isomerase [Prosthecochloris sp.]